MPSLNVSPLAFRRWDSPDAARLLFVHGFMGSCDDWEPVCAELAGMFSCLAVNLPAAGRSDRERRDFDAPLGIEQMASELAAAVQSLELQDFSVVAYSMGGRVLLRALQTAQLHPRALIFVSTSPGLEDEQERAARIALDDKLATMLESEGLEAFLARWYRSSVFRSLEAKPELRASLIEKRLAANEARWLAKQLRDASPGRTPPAWEYLSQINIPQLWLAGEEDPRYCGYLRRIAAMLPKAETVILPDCGHAVAEEVPRLLATHIVQFLQKVEAELS